MMQIETHSLAAAAALPATELAEAPARQATRDERRLVKGCAQGDPTALAALYDRHAAMLLALIRRIVGNREEAEDVLQEVFLYAWNRAAEYSPRKASVVTWLALIARSRAIDQFRKSRTHNRALDRVENESPWCAFPKAATAVLDGERRQRVRAAMKELPAKQRQVLELAYFQGMTQLEIARRVQIPLGTVKTRTLLAMRKLHAAVAAEISQLI